MKKILLKTILVPFFLIIEIFHWISFIIDKIFFPSYKKILIKEPLYITGMPRTATTSIHSIISNDSKRFTTMKLWEIVLAPSIFQKKLFLLIKKIDSKLNHPLMKFLTRFDILLFKKFQHFHPMSLFDIEEDEYLLFHNFSSGLLTFLFPSLKPFFLGKILGNGSKSNGDMEFYQNCIKKHLYVFGRNRTYLAKSPSHILRYDVLFRIFPDMKLIYMLRAPHKSITSTISLFNNINNIFYSDIKTSSIVEKTIVMADQCFNNLLELNELYDSKSYIVIIFEKFTKHPELVLSDLYDHFNYSISGDFASIIKNYCKKSNEFKSKHKYSLEEFALSKDDISQRYQDIYEKYYKQAISLEVS